MSKRPLPEVKPTWFKATERWQELLILSEPTHWVSHWDASLRRARRCGGMNCYMCAVGYAKQLRVIVLGIDPRGKEQLLELRERHREQLDAWSSTVGLRIRLKKEGSAANSPVAVQGMGNEYAIERDIGRLVAVLGLDPIRCEDRPGDELEQELSGSTSEVQLPT